MKVWKLIKKLPYLPVLIGPYVSLYLGMALNQIVMLANGNQMPVYFPKSLWGDVCSDPGYLATQGDLVHTCMNTSTHLKFLADWISLGNPVPVLIMSPGDIFIFLYEAVIPFAFYVWLALFVVKYFGGQHEVVQPAVPYSGNLAPAFVSGTVTYPGTAGGVTFTSSEPVSQSSVGQASDAALRPGDSA